MNCMLHFKRKSLASIIVFLLLLVSGCNILAKTGNENNPLYGKTTDDRIIMCLEKAYPEHLFHMVKSYDDSIREGVFADENGVEFKVTKVFINNLYHFGCKDQYLYVLLEEQEYLKKVEEIMKKNDLPFEGIISPSTKVMLDEKLDKQELASIVLEVLNCVEVPEVIWPYDTTFSTREVNYYTQPKWGTFSIDFEDCSRGITFSVVFHFEDKELTVDEIVARMDEEIKMVEEEYPVIYGAEIKGSQEEIQEERTQISSGSYLLPSNWSENKELSTEELYVYTENGKYPSEEDSYFIVACRTNPYEASQHEIFRTAILSQLSSNMNIPEGSSINVTGFTSEQGITVYSFEIAMSKNEVMTMHYIIGEKQHCLIQEINYNNSEACSSAVQELVNSFLWRE